MRPGMELGIYTFGELTADPVSGATASPDDRMRDASRLRYRSGTVARRTPSAAGPV